MDLSTLTIDALSSLTLDAFSLLDLGSSAIADRGRQPIAVDQPPGGGTNYPFIKPSAEVQYLLGDFYLSYEDDRCQYRQPFSLSWLYGFGDQVGVPEGAATPTHERDLIVRDADGRTVFDSTLATSYKTKFWADRLIIVEWLTASTVCRCTQHLNWSQADVDQGYSRYYGQHIVPVDGRLDPRVVNRLPARLRSIRVGPTTLTGNRVRLDSGYNVALSVVADAEDYSDLQLDLADTVEVEKGVAAGQRVTTRIQIQANPGDGMGQKPGCEDVVVTLKELGGAKPNAAGNLNLDMEGCLRLQRPVALDTLSPRTFRYASAGLTANAARSTLALHNDCGPCCDCNFFTRTYKGLRRQWLLWEDLATRSQAVCHTLGDNVDRWHLSKSCREQNTIRTVLLPEKGCKVAVGALYCNNHKCCAAPLVMRFSFRFYRGGVATPINPADCRNGVASGSGFDMETTKIALAGSWPIYEYTFDYANPTETSKVGFRLCIPQCQSGDSLSMYVTVHYPEFVAEAGQVCVTPAGDVPQELQSIWDESGWEPLYLMRAVKPAPMVPLDNTNPYCASCTCDWKGSSGGSQG